MRIAIMLLILGILQARAADAYSQKTRLSLDFNDTELIKVLDNIEVESEFFFLYNEKLLDTDRKVNITANNQLITKILDNLFAGTDVRYSIIDRKIILAPDYLTTENNIPATQQLVISGKVTDAATNEPMPGVNIVAKGTTTGTTTDISGNYSLEVSNENAILLFSFIGYVSQEVPISSRTSLNVALVSETVGLEEVVVIGYGTMRKSDLTGSVMRADIGTFKEASNVSIGQSLQGIVPGLSIGQVDQAGESPSMEIRGRTTLGGNQNVLIVLDGIIFSGSLTDLNPVDIESIDILKDPSSMAIYGAQAANGVMLITSRQGSRSMKPMFNYSNSFTTQNPTSPLSLQNREQNIQRIYDMYWNTLYQAPDYTQLKPGYGLDNTGVSFSSLDLIKTGQEYDWWDNCTDPGYINNHNLSVQGNKDDFSYFLSGGYTKQKGFIINDKYTRISTRINLSSKIFDWFEIGTQTFGTFSDFSGGEPDLSNIRTVAPFSVPFDENGELIINPMGDIVLNPFIPTKSNDFDNRNELFANFFISIDLPFVPGLNYRINFGNNYGWARHYYSNEYVGATTDGEAYKSNSSKYDRTFDNILSYNNTFNVKHRINLTLLAGIREINSESTSANGNTYPSIRLGYNNLGLAGIKQISSSAWDESYSYQMFRFNYQYDERFLVTTTLRRDGFSGFAKNHKFGLFPSVGLGWVISKEAFFNLDWVEQFKLRASFGSNGNLTNRYSSLSKMNQYPAYVLGDGGSPMFGQQVTTLGNADLSWEKTIGYNFGVDFSFLKNKINGSVDYYLTTTNDLLFDVVIPQITGFSSIKSNLGEIANNGIEFLLNTEVIKITDFTWNLNFNIASNKNKIISLIGLDANGDGKEDDLTSSNLFIGESINSVYSYESDGIYQIGDDVPARFYIGTHRIIDNNNDNYIDPSDRVIIGRQEPAYQFGITNELQYKDFTFKFFINSVQGGKDGYLGSMAPPSGWGTIGDISRYNIYNIDYWTPSNPDGKYDVPGTASAVSYQYYESRSFVRLQDVVLAYNFNSKVINKIGIQRGKIFLSGKNLLTLTKWGGWDPETGAGLQHSERPVLRGLSMGVDFSF